MAKQLLIFVFSPLILIVSYCIFICTDLSQRKVGSAERLMQNPNAVDYHVIFEGEKGVIPTQIGPACTPKKVAQQISGVPYILSAQCLGNTLFELHFSGPGFVRISEEKFRLAYDPTKVLMA